MGDIIVIIYKKSVILLGDNAIKRSNFYMLLSIVTSNQSNLHIMDVKDRKTQNLQIN